jgi:hypothetical protein
MKTPWPDVVSRFDALWAGNMPMDLAFLDRYLAGHGYGPEPVVPARPKRPRRPSMRSLIARAEKAGKPVSSVTIDGTTLHFGEPEQPSTNPWDEVLRREPH